MQTILVGYDDSEQAQRALDRAIELGKALGAEIVVASVAPVAISSGRSAGPIDPTDTPQQHRDQLQTAAEKVQAAGLSVKLVPAIGHPAETIVHAANEAAADLIVVGSRELGVIPRLLGQSVSTSVAAHATCDVLIVH